MSRSISIEGSVIILRAFLGKTKISRPTLKRDTIENIQFYIMMLPTIILIIIFMYIPMYGIVIAFQDYTPGAPFFSATTKWVGLKHFRNFIESFYFTRIIKNTLVLNLMNLAFNFWVPIIFALLLNELRDNFFKKFVQTASYMPYFISNVVVAGMVLNYISKDGILNQFLSLFGIESKAWNTDAAAFPWIFTFTNLWKGFGWNSILYLSTISSIDTNLYEAASIDGAGRIRKMWSITLPHMLPLIAIQLIFAVGSLLSIGSDLILLIYNPSTYKTADVLGTYVYRDGLMGGNFSSATAIGLFMTVINLAMMVGANMLSRKMTDYSLW